MGLIRDKDETAYRKEQYWDALHRMLIKKKKIDTKQFMFALRRAQQAPPYGDTAAEKANSVEFPGFHLANTKAIPTVAPPPSVSEKRLYPPPLVTLYRGTPESFISYALTTWLGSRKALEEHLTSRIMKTASKGIAHPLHYQQFHHIDTQAALRFKTLLPD